MQSSERMGVSNHQSRQGFLAALAIATCNACSCLQSERFSQKQGEVHAIIRAHWRQQSSEQAGIPGCSGNCNLQGVNAFAIRSLQTKAKGSACNHQSALASAIIRAGRYPWLLWQLQPARRLHACSQIALDQSKGESMQSSERNGVSNHQSRQGSLAALAIATCKAYSCLLSDRFRQKQGEVHAIIRAHWCQQSSEQAGIPGCSGNCNLQGVFMPAVRSL